MNKIRRNSISSEDTNKSSIEDDISANLPALTDAEPTERPEPCIQFAKQKVCMDGENCKLDHQRKLCRSFLLRGECSFEDNFGRKCNFEHFQEICEEFRRRGKCGFEKRTGKECIRRHERGTLYKKGVSIAGQFS